MECVLEKDHTLLFFFFFFLLIPVIIIITEISFIAVKFDYKDCPLFSHCSEEEANNNSAHSHHSLEKNIPMLLLYVLLYFM